MYRSLILLCLLAFIAVLNAVPVAVVERYVPVAVDPNGVPLHRYKRQFGFGMPFFGGAYGNSYGMSESFSFNAYNNGFNTGFWG
ncbi:hypothetical protein OESDEN_20651 [Oesophagostomum dentatum]|uniref:Sulfur globule protein CV3 domain protein n=1 Tax=Oesophagostomum dentatum TaxID=61180 RepID=A0A0B1S925_OESDE|nr:hypothetical protein OESDEN_20651 [Oesophagostomum dentatum]